MTLPVSDHSPIVIPNLAGIIKKDDVYTKDSDKYKADYVAWARIAMLLHQHAPGWTFSLVCSNSGGLVHVAPDETGYLIGQFSYRTEKLFYAGPEFPFPIMGHRNNPIPVNAISARILTDSHRRCLCAAAAFTFGLGAELWAQMEIDDASAVSAANKTAPEAPSSPRKAPVKQPAPPRPKSASEDPTTATAGTLEGDRKTLQALLVELEPATRNEILSRFKSFFDLSPDAKVLAHVTTPKHVEFLRSALEAIATSDEV